MIREGILIAVALLYSAAVVSLAVGSTPSVGHGICHGPGHAGHCPAALDGHSTVG